MADLEKTEKRQSKIEELLKKILKKKAWNSDPIIIEYSSKTILLLWVVYFLAKTINDSSHFETLKCSVIELLNRQDIAQLITNTSLLLVSLRGFTAITRKKKQNHYLSFFSIPVCLFVNMTATVMKTPLLQDLVNQVIPMIAIIIIVTAYVYSIKLNGIDKGAKQFFKTFINSVLLSLVFMSILIILITTAPLEILATLNRHTHDILFFLTGIYFVLTIIYTIAKSTQPYSSYLSITTGKLKSNREEQTLAEAELAHFLNTKSIIGQNIFWLDAPWGTGKTTFIHRFFEEHFVKKNEIYYISCFGIKTREQAEKILLDEIIAHSNISVLTHLPIIGNLVQLIFKILGLHAMKKDAIVIFDDLERVTYTEEGDGKDNPQDYNDLLGFIDFLAHTQMIKVIVLYNSVTLTNTHEKIIQKKFKPVIHHFSPSEAIIRGILSRNKEALTRQHRKFFEEVFTYLLPNCSDGNLRIFNHILTATSHKNFSDIIRYIIEKNILGFPKQVWDFTFINYSPKQPIKYTLLLLAMLQTTTEDTGSQSYCTEHQNNPLDYYQLYDIAQKYQAFSLEQDDSEEHLLLQLLYKQACSSDKDSSDKNGKELTFTIGHLIFMFNFLHPEQAINGTPIKDYMKNHFKVEEQSTNSWRVNELVEEFQIVFQAFRTTNARHEIKFLHDWQLVMLELKDELEQGNYYNFLTLEALNRTPNADKTYLEHMPNGLFPELDDYRERIKSLLETSSY